MFFPSTFQLKASFQRIFRTISKEFPKCFPHSKGFQSVSEFQELLQIFWETNWLQSWEFIQHSFAFKLFARENVAFYTKQDFLFHISTTLMVEVLSNWFRLLEIEANVVIYFRSPLLGACNSHNKPVQRHFYRPVYFYIFFLRNRPVPHEHASTKIKQCGLTWTCRDHVDISPCLWLQLVTRFLWGSELEINSN